MTVLIDKDTIDGLSALFEVPVGGQVQVAAYGLDLDDYVEIELVRLSSFQRGACECPPGKVTFPAVIWAAPLMCCDAPVRLTPEHPVVLIDFPQAFKLRAHFHGDLTQGDKEVWRETVSVLNVTDAMRGCPCVSGGA